MEKSLKQREQLKGYLKDNSSKDLETEVREKRKDLVDKFQKVFKKEDDE